MLFDGDKEVWLPKTLREWDGSAKTMQLPEWFTTKKGLYDSPCFLRSLLFGNDLFLRGRFLRYHLLQRGLHSGLLHRNFLYGFLRRQFCWHTDSPLIHFCTEMFWGLLSSISRQAPYACCPFPTSAGAPLLRSTKTFHSLLFLFEKTFLGRAGCCFSSGSTTLKGNFHPLPRVGPWLHYWPCLPSSNARFCGSVCVLVWPMRGRIVRNWAGQLQRGCTAPRSASCTAPASPKPKSPAGFRSGGPRCAASGLPSSETIGFTAQCTTMVTNAVARTCFSDPGGDRTDAHA